MKKSTKSLFIGILSMLALVGCNRTAESSSVNSAAGDSATGDSASAVTSSKGEEEVTSSSKKDTSTEDNYLEPYEINQALENHQVTFMTTEQTVDIYGDNACYVDDGSTDYGYIYFNNSVWQYGIDDDDVLSLDNCIYGSISSQYDLTSLLTFYSAIDVLAKDTAGANWEETKTAHKYTTTDEDTIDAILTLGGLSSESSSYYSISYSADSLTMKANKDGSVTISGTVTETVTSSYLGSSTDTTKMSLKLSNIGDNENEAVSSFLENPQVPTKTDFDETLKTYMTTYTGQILPYNNKFTSYSSYSLETSSYTSNEYYVYQDFKCGNLITEYGAQLEALGFVRQESSSSVSNSGTVVNYCKVKSAKTATKGEVDYFVSLAYYSKEDMAEEGYDAFYQDGLFMIEGSIVEQALALDTVADINAYVAGNLKDTNGNAYVPAFNFSTATTSIKLTDYTSYLSAYYGCTAYYMISGNFSTAAEALSNMNTWAASLVSAGFAYDKTYYGGNTSSTTVTDETDMSLSEDNRTCGLTYGSQTDTSKPYIIVTIALDDSDTSGANNFNGDFAINIMAF